MKTQVDSGQCAPNRRRKALRRFFGRGTLRAEHNAEAEPRAGSGCHENGHHQVRVSEGKGETSNAVSDSGRHAPRVDERSVQQVSW